MMLAHRTTGWDVFADLMLGFAWPLVVFGVVLLFRGEIRRLIAGLSDLELWSERIGLRISTRLQDWSRSADEMKRQIEEDAPQEQKEISAREDVPAVQDSVQGAIRDGDVGVVHLWMTQLYTDVRRVYERVLSDSPIASDVILPEIGVKKTVHSFRYMVEELSRFKVIDHKTAGVLIDFQVGYEEYVLKGRAVKLPPGALDGFVSVAKRLSNIVEAHYKLYRYRNTRKSDKGGGDD